jgi:hypothetical protein
VNDEPRYNLKIERYGALGLLEHEEALEGATRGSCERLIARQFETMTPLDRCTIDLFRPVEPTDG